ncbi:MAG: hypothetical protein EBT15_07100 [Betaproteobacteria bacterium]|nr:hypothetical protein [Betaproteobacteria bacterium]
MLTQATPSIVKALQGVLPPNALKQLTQALGNCNQPLTHRGDVNFQPDWSQGNDRGVYGANGRTPWNPSNFQALFPQLGDSVFIDIAQPGTTIDGRTFTNYGGNVFDFTSRQNFNVTQIHGGPTIYNGGDTIFNNDYGGGGGTGREGKQGAAGQDGKDGIGIGFGGPPGEPGAAGTSGRDGRDGRDGQDAVGGGFLNARIDSITVARNRAIVGTVPIPTNAIKDASVRVGVVTDAIRAVTGMSGAFVMVPRTESCITGITGTVAIPAPGPSTVVYDKAAGISGGSIAVPNNAISGGSITYDRPTGLSGSITYDRPTGASGNITYDRASGLSGNVAYDRATTVSGTAQVYLPVPTGGVGVFASATTPVTVVTGVTASFNTNTCTVSVTATTTTVNVPTGYTATFSGSGGGWTPVSLSGLTIQSTPTNLSLAGASLSYTPTTVSLTSGSVSTTPTSLSLSSGSVSTTPTSVSLSGTTATTGNVSVSGLTISTTAATASVSGGFAGGTYNLSLNPTTGPTETTMADVDATSATFTYDYSIPESTSFPLSDKKPADTDPRAVVTGIADQQPITKRFYAP